MYVITKQKLSEERRTQSLQINITASKLIFFYSIVLLLIGIVVLACCIQNGPHGLVYFASRFKEMALVVIWACMHTDGPALLQCQVAIPSPRSIRTAVAGGPVHRIEVVAVLGDTKVEDKLSLI